MKRSDFLKATGALFALPLAAPAEVLAQKGDVSSPNKSNCVLVPSETAGPFPLDLTDNTYYFRQDIRENREGVILRQKIRIIGNENCEPMPNVRVNIWHCDRDGNYSGYGSEAGLTYCRGYQITDANGDCEFVTIVPGWYPGRVTHVHFQVAVSSMYSAVSQWTWPHETVVNAIEAHPDLYPAGPDPLSPSQDGVFIDGFDLQMATLEWDPIAEEYTSFYEATVEGSGTLGVGYEELVTSRLVEVGELFPNPGNFPLCAPITLSEAATVNWMIFDLSGQILEERHIGTLSPGQHQISIESLRLPAAGKAYVVQFNVSNQHSNRSIARSWFFAGR